MKKILFILIAILALGAALFFLRKPTNILPLVAIANYGPHASLTTSIDALKEHLTLQGFIEHKTCRYRISDVGFDSSLIPQMISQLLSEKPTIFVALTTPVAQQAKLRVKNIPLVFMDITDPVQAGLLSNPYLSENNITGSSDKQDINALLLFVRSLLPDAQRVGILYATAEANDAALVAMMNKSAQAHGMSVVAIGIDHQRDIAIRMQAFKDKVDFLYVGTSGPIQPALPIIAAQARLMHIPIFNAEQQAVKDGLALASFGVDYTAVGNNAALLVGQLLQSKSIAELQPLYPSFADHQSVINGVQAQIFNISIPHDALVVGLT